MIYLDANATTALLPSALKAMSPYFVNCFGNPSSKHPAGIEARAAIEEARRDIAKFINASPGEIFFTSGGTESVCLALQSALARSNRGLIISAAEHSCVLDVADSWRRLGRRIDTVPVDRHGIIDIIELDRLLKETEAVLVSVIWINNETGVINPISEITKLCKRHGALCHIDAVQAPTRVDIDTSKMPFDYLSLSAHKFHGPKGVGVLFVRSGSPMTPLMPGHQERGLRGGTENTPGIVGTAEALRQQANWPCHLQKLRALRDRLENEILTNIPGSSINGASAERAWNTTNIFFPGRNAADMVAALGRSGVYASAGAACSTGGNPSHVLMAMGYTADRANSSVRFSLSHEITNHDITRALEIISIAHASILTNWGNI